MFSLSDILKKYREIKKRVAAEQNEPSIKELSLEDKVAVLPAISKETQNQDSLKAGELYAEAILLSQQIYKTDFEYEIGLIVKVNSVVEKIADALSLGNKELLRLALTDYPQSQDYYPFHAANVCIISLEIGSGFNYDSARLLELGSAAFLHDLGMVKYFEIIRQPKILSHEEYNKIKEHPKLGLVILESVKEESNQGILAVVAQEHERLDGSGYPNGLKDKEITEYAHIVGLADVYEAMVHPRPYRGRYTPLEIIRVILGNKGAFDSKIIKVLIERVGVFPVGVMVRLNTKEMGVVAKENTHLPLRPVVNVLFDASGQEMKQTKQLDLSSNPMIYIEECLECIKK